MSAGGCAENSVHIKGGFGLISVACEAWVGAG